MAKFRNIVLIVFFLGMIYCVPVTQVILDLAEGDSPQILELFSAAPTEEHLRSFEADLEEYSFFEENIRPVFQVARYFVLRDMGAKALRGNDGWFFFHQGVKYLTEPYFRELVISQVKASGVVIGGDGQAEEQGGDPVEVIVDFAGQMKDRGILLLVVIVPGKASIYPDKLTTWADPAAPVYAHTTRFIRELTERGIEVVDIHEVLSSNRQSADARAEPLYMLTDTHWTGAGVRLAAEVIARRVKREPWYRELEHTERYDRTRLAVTRRGDIPEMTQMPLQKHLFADETVYCYQVRQKKSRELYENDDDSPILLLGDSFSRVFQTDEPEAAGLIANLAYELQLPLASIVNNGGASTLVRQQLYRKIDLLENKRLIIWEFVERDIRFGMKGWQFISLPRLKSHI